MFRIIKISNSVGGVTIRVRAVAPTVGYAALGVNNNVVLIVKSVHDIPLLTIRNLILW